MLADDSPDAHAGNRFGQRGKALNRLPMVFHKFRIVPLECFAVKDPIKLVSECFLQFLPIIYIPANLFCNAGAGTPSTNRAVCVRRPA